MAGDDKLKTDAAAMRAALIEYQTRLQQLGIERAEWLRQTREQTRRLWFFALDVKAYTERVHHQLHELEAALRRAEEILAPHQPASATTPRQLPRRAPYARTRGLLPDSTSAGALAPPETLALEVEHPAAE